MERSMNNEMLTIEGHSVIDAPIGHQFEYKTDVMGLRVPGGVVLKFFDISFSQITTKSDVVIGNHYKDMRLISTQFIPLPDRHVPVLRKVEIREKGGEPAIYYYHGQAACGEWNEDTKFILESMDGKMEWKYLETSKIRFMDRKEGKL